MTPHLPSTRSSPQARCNAPLPERYSVAATNLINIQQLRRIDRIVDEGEHERDRTDHTGGSATRRGALPRPEHPRHHLGRLAPHTRGVLASRTASRATTTCPTRSSPRPATPPPSTSTCGRAPGSGPAARSTFPKPATTTCTTSATARRSSCAGPTARSAPFYNACLHRGTQLKPPASAGYSTKLRCPFHGWTWSLDGELIDLPCEWDFPHVDAEQYQLPQIRTGQWGGFIFVNFDDDAPPLEEYLGVLPEHFADWDLADRYVEVHIRKKLPANWKASAEAFLEAYHILETHPQSIYTAGDANAQYDVFGDNVSRFIHTIGTTSPHVPEAKRPDEAGILNMLMARKNPGAEVPEIPDGERARDVYARFMQTTLGEQYDNDFSHLSVSETIDSIEYFLFPNAFFFPGLQIPLCYRFRPDGPDPDRCIFDVLYLRPKPRSGKVPLPAEPFDLDVDDSYTTRARPAEVAGRRARPGHHQPRRADSRLQGQQEARTNAGQLPGSARPPLPSDSSQLHRRGPQPPGEGNMSRQPIHDLVHTYADAVVRRDATQWSSTWAADAVWELGKGRRVEGRDNILALWNSAMDGFAAVVQNVVNGTADARRRQPAPELAAGTSSSTGNAPTTRAASCSPTTTTPTSASTAEWLFASRELVVQYSGPADLSGTFQNAKV